MLEKMVVIMKETRIKVGFMGFLLQIFFLSLNDNYNNHDNNNTDCGEVRQPSLLESGGLSGRHMLSPLPRKMMMMMMMMIMINMVNTVIMMRINGRLSGRYMLSPHYDYSDDDNNDEFTL